MELQWPLILFTTLLAWAAGLFAAQCLWALRGKGGRAQMPALIASAALLVVGGIAVFFHLEHWERIFNGFGHLSSGITQELIAIVVLAVVMVVYFVYLRRGGDEAKVPAWLAAVGLVLAVVLVAVMGHSYMMAARPAWDSLLGPLTLLGAACAAGPLTFAVIEAARGEAAGRAIALFSLIGSIANLAASVAYLAFMEMASASYTDVGFYYDPTHPTAGMVDVAALSPFAGESVAMVAVAVVAAAVPVAAALVGRKTGNWKAWGAAGALGAVVGAVALRMAFYSAGASVYLFY